MAASIIQFVNAFSDRAAPCAVIIRFRWLCLMLASTFRKSAWKDIQVRLVAALFCRQNDAIALNGLPSVDVALKSYLSLKGTNLLPFQTDPEGKRF